MLKVKKVYKNSIAKRIGLEKGDELIKIGGYTVYDELDFLFVESAPKCLLTVRDKRKGEEHEILVEREEDEVWGVEFIHEEKIRTCHNRCLFCFVDQMPKGLRQSLYVKDDDYSMSFACGNFVTLTNLKDEELERIIRLGLSPLYVSVHTMNPELRVKLLRNRFAGKIVEQIDTLAKAGIEIHCQAVVVPNMNDGEELKYTARKLFEYYPTVKDLAVVPTGLTKYRVGLYQIPDVDKEYSEKFLDVVDELNREFGVNFVQPADEYFIKAERAFKPLSFYGDFEQIENGIGMTSKFVSEVKSALENIGENAALKKRKKTLVISGVSAAKTLSVLLEETVKKVDNLSAEVLAVENEFFGKTVTCTGLLTAVDVLKGIEEYCEKGGEFDEVLIAGNMMQETKEVFLCGTTLKQFKKRLRRKRVLVNREGGYGFVQALIQEK